MDTAMPTERGGSRGIGRLSSGGVQRVRGLRDAPVGGVSAGRQALPAPGFVVGSVSAGNSDSA
ncbi:MAG TPA: hypothetical protein VE084_04620, partial [Burkholderiaceae bacterium]|nr:hypothetical protein [Burkholderiaceae bacterium]